LTAGHDAKPFARAMESLASCTGLLPERAWDGADLPQAYIYCGRPTGSATPLMWAHAEYIKLLRSVRDGKVSDLIYDVAKRYLGGARIVNYSKSGSLPGRCGASTALCASHPRRAIVGKGETIWCQLPQPDKAR
jgi:hypothetical protein